jgi:hypothetical protein
MPAADTSLGEYERAHSEVASKLTFTLSSFQNPLMYRAAVNRGSDTLSTQPELLKEAIEVKSAWRSISSSKQRQL